MAKASELRDKERKYVREQSGATFEGNQRMALDSDSNHLREFQ